MKVLVTGGAGFIGSHIAEYYANKGAKVIVFDNLSRNQILGKTIGDPLYNWNYLKTFKNIDLIKGDIRNFQSLIDASKGVDTIFHTAAQVAVTTSLTDPRTDFEINALGTFNVLEAARLSDCIVVYCSTNKVYGENVNKVLVKEDKNRYVFKEKQYKDGIPETFPTDLSNHSPYGCSKLCGDVYMQDYAETYGLKTGVFRMSCIYGDRQFGVEDQGWISWFAISTILGKPLTIYGDGKQVRDILYVDDLIDAFNAFMESNLKHEVFNMGGGPQNTLSLIELLNLLKTLVGKKPTISYSDWREGDQKVYISNISKAMKILSWKPKTSADEGVERLVRWANLFFKQYKA